MTILLLPGLDGTGLLFDSFLRQLPEPITRRVCPLPHGADQSPESLAEQLARQGLLRDNVTVLAESFSGRVAYELLQRGDTKVRALILVSSFFTRPNRLLAFSPIVPFSVVPWHCAPPWALRFFCAGTDAPEYVIDSIQSALRMVPRETLSARVRALACLEEPGADIAVPCLSLEPSSDRLVSARATADLTRWCRNLSVKRIDGPHFLLQARPRECAAAVVKFLTDLDHRP